MLDGQNFLEAKRNFLESFSDYDDESYSSKRIRSDECESLGKFVSDDQSDDSWSLDLHREMVGVIFSLGLHICSPSIILENMSLKSDQVNTERIKSRLQKVRMNADKAKSEFLTAYDAALVRMNQVINETTVYQRKRRDILQIVKSVVGSEPGYLLHAEPAAYITLCSMSYKQEDETLVECRPMSDYPLTLIQELKQDPAAFLDQNPCIELPSLTIEELQSPLGALFRYIMATFTTLKQHILETRMRNECEAPSEICKHNMTSFPSSAPLTSNHKKPFPSPVQSSTSMDIGAYYVYEPPVSSLKRANAISNDTIDSVDDCLSTSSFVITHVNPET